MVWTNIMFRRACEDNLAADSKVIKKEWHIKEAFGAKHLRMASDHATH
jgi:hypothetical protein